MRVAPETNKISKWVLISILFFLGAVSILGGLFGKEDDNLFMAGFMMVLFGIGVCKLKPNEMNFFGSIMIIDRDMGMLKTIVPLLIWVLLIYSCSVNDPFGIQKRKNIEREVRLEAELQKEYDDGVRR